jgi:uncharacterized protein (UPF0332 family)
MTPEASRFLQKAHKHLANADIMRGVGLHEEAGRAAYLAGFHAAQAFIFENTGRVFKTHRGVQTEFLRMTKDDARVPPELRIFLSQSYNLKSIADYETGPGAEITAERAGTAIDAGKQFLATIIKLLPPAKTAPQRDPEPKP